MSNIGLSKAHLHVSSASPVSSNFALPFLRSLISPPAPPPLPVEGAYFVGRKEVMDWINTTTDMSLSKIEDTASGAVACQLLDIMYPGQVPMHKVNWAAKQNFEFVGNYKILQTCFTKLHIDRHVDVDRLISGRYMDNLEFMQWFKRFFELSGVAKGDYDALAVRAKGKGADKVPSASGKAAVSGGSAAPSSSSSASSLKAPAPVAKRATSASASTASSTITTTSAAAAKPMKENKAPEASSAAAAKAKPASPVVAAASVASAAELLALRQEKDDAVRSMAELRLEMDGMEKERDFYFDKLRDIEILLQENEDAGNKTETTDAIFKILYATAEGFEQAPAPAAESKAPALPEAEEAVEAAAAAGPAIESVDETY